MSNQISINDNTLFHIQAVQSMLATAQEEMTPAQFREWILQATNSPDFSNIGLVQQLAAKIQLTSQSGLFKVALSVMSIIQMTFQLTMEVDEKELTAASDAFLDLILSRIQEIREQQRRKDGRLVSLTHGGLVDAHGKRVSRMMPGKGLL